MHSAILYQPTMAWHILKNPNSLTLTTVIYYYGSCVCALTGGWLIFGVGSSWVILLVLARFTYMSKAGWESADLSQAHLGVTLFYVFFILLTHPSHVMAKVQGCKSSCASAFQESACVRKLASTGQSESRSCSQGGGDSSIRSGKALQSYLAEDLERGEVKSRSQQCSISHLLWYSMTLQSRRMPKGPGLLITPHHQA